MDGFGRFFANLQRQLSTMLQAVLNLQFVQWIVDFYSKLTTDRHIDAEVDAGAIANGIENNSVRQRIKWACGAAEDANESNSATESEVGVGDSGNASESDGNQSMEKGEAGTEAKAATVTPSLDTKCQRNAVADPKSDQEQQLPAVPVTETVTDVGLAGVLNAIPSEKMGNALSSNKNKQKTNKNVAGGEGSNSKKSPTSTQKDHTQNINLSKQKDGGDKQKSKPDIIISSSEEDSRIAAENNSKRQEPENCIQKTNSKEITLKSSETAEVKAKSVADEQKPDFTQISSEQSNSKETDLNLNTHKVETEKDSHVQVKVDKTILQKLNLHQLEAEEPKAIEMMKSSDIHSVPIAEGTNAESVLYRIKRGSTLRVHGDASLLGREIILYTNYPAEGKKFVRTEYRILDWHSRNGKPFTTNLNKYAHVVDTDIFSQVKMNLSGTFRFWFQYKESTRSEPDGSLYVQVEPTLHVGPPGSQKIIPLNSVRCQTVITKLLGPISTWESKLRVAKESGYNVIHFTPIQELGGSRSAYSLRDQLKVNPNFAAKKGGTIGFDDVEKVIKKCRQEWGIASICDIVLNHTANESDWVREHPEVTYNCATSPYLRPAFLFDALLANCSQDVAAGYLENVGVPAVIDREEHLQALKYQLHNVYLPKVNIHELFQCNIVKYVDEFMALVRTRVPPKHVADESRFNEIQLITDPQYHRLGATIDLNLALEIFNAFHGDCFDEESRFRKCAETLRHRLETLNEEVRAEIQGYLGYAIENCLAGVRYERVQEGGPKVRDITENHPLFMQYFTQIKAIGKSLKEIEQGMYGDLGRFFQAHNGWVMGSSDPLRDFAEEQPGRGNVYLKRELIAWGDSVKLRYGKKPEDSPYLWKHMTEYVVITAKIFDGVRLDNCHSTPIHVAEYLLDAARAVNQDLYVVAELFTNSDATDNAFVNRLGITSLIREALSAWDSHEEGRLVYRFGGEPVGAFYVNPKRDLAPSIAHALFMDQTHDNPSPVEKRSVYDLLPSSALVSMACCATGSNRGYDELVPHHIHVVDEERQYQEWGKNVDFNTGIIAAKRALNLLHGQLAEEGFNQVYVDQMDPNIVAVTRHSPTTHESVILVAHTAFGYPHPNAGPTGVRSLRFEGTLNEIILEADISMKSDKPYDRPGPFKKDPNYIKGFSQFQLNLREHIPLNKSKIFRATPYIDGNITQLDFENLYPGSIVAVRVSLHNPNKPHAENLQKLVISLQYESGPMYDELREIIGKLDLVDLNRALFTCDEEERDHGYGGATYDIPNYGRIVYCGLQGFISILTEISPRNDLGHPLCNNLRDGNWMLDYVADRLSHREGTKVLSKWLKATFEPLKNIPRYLIPCYFDAILSGLYEALVGRAYQLMPEFIRDGHNFPQTLALATLQFLSACKSANLPPLSPAVTPQPPETCVTLSAGLPHFSTGYMRCWGRDTFIALRGVMYLTGRFQEARYIILGFGQCLRHGLIPNLLDNGTKPRFNCRDAVWWWLNSIKQYVNEAPQGRNILNDMVSRIFPYDDSEPHGRGKFDQKLIDVMQEALQVHFQGLQYRERNAGYEIDAHMTDQGFNNNIGVHPETGFVFGGNIANCGTWMDKMGSSEKAGNRGRPATPRDGSAVELVGLQMSVLRFMQMLNEKGVIEYKSVERQGPNGENTTWTYKQWADRIQNNFEKYFFVKESETALMANKKNIYKDSYGASQAWTDYQLRCNFPITMVVAPELFNPQNAWKALEQAREHLLGPLGMKTLDPDDWNYRPNYDNSNDADDCTVAHGFNYHQGPEWIWPIGFYLRARLIFAKKCGYLDETIAETWSILRAHFKELHTSHWRGLPELTNDNGAYCHDSCRTQAWSVATVLEVLHDLHAIGGDV
ncbi:glycogen debranching enzyme isoform X1 [Anastrepha ludens]|uniref:glycogen debranching enzyme isoform X1 n=2 Tax=Anastrepha ludens TaxID=28586 RepID=UPI0023B03789|nr:glycogen debranching enzyme isoform X1 [Anastrepha ludens]